MANTVTDSVTVADAQKQTQQGIANLFDVRNFDEYAVAHAPSSVCIPLSDLERRAGEIPTDRPAFMICRSGNRSSMAVERLRALGMINIVNVDGGMNAWEKSGLPVLRQRGAMPLERQVRIVAGALVFGFSLLGFFVAHGFFYGAAFIGFMLTFTGILGICPMMSVLKIMPWNRVNSPATCAK